VFRGNAKVAELVAARLRTSLNGIGAEPSNEVHGLLHEHARAHQQPLRYVSLSERLQRLKKVD
jgi:hypothetical protein